MATPPVFTFRLPVEQADQLRSISRVYSDSGSSGILLRDMVSAALSGDAQTMAAFNARLLGRLGEQLTFDLMGKKHPKRPKKKGGRRAKPR